MAVCPGVKTALLSAEPDHSAKQFAKDRSTIKAVKAL
jgi:hypothetical protein